MTTLKCDICPYTADSEDAPDVCPECDGKLYATSVIRAREIAAEDEIDALWSAYYAVKRGDAEIAARTPEPGFLMRRQAGG